jgi:hypothetical protein
MASQISIGQHFRRRRCGSVLTGPVKRRIGRQLLAALFALCLLSAHGVHSAESGPEAQGEWLDEFLVAVTRAATKGPQWQTRRDRIQRDLEDISYHVTELSTAAKTADRARAEQASRQVLALLHRGQAKGYYASEEVESLVQLLKKE